MLLLFISWCYIFLTSFTLGFALSKITRLNCRDFAVLVFLGLFSVTIFAGFWAVFGRINVEFHGVLLLINIIVVLKFKSALIGAYRRFYQQLSAISKSLRGFLLLMGLLLLAQSAAPSRFIDNEIYYIQTIKWLNEYGFVKGLANLHFFLGQTSGWHILQSAFSFSFVSENFNDINGFCLLMGNVFAVTKLSDFKRTYPELIIGLMPLANVVLFQFSGVPSPDLAVCVFAFMVFYYFVENFENGTSEIFGLIFIFSIFIIFIKITALPILLLPLVFFIWNYKKILKRSIAVYVIGVIVFTLFVLKNIILTGYPLFPSVYFKEQLAIAYAVPDDIYQFWFNKQKLYDFVVLKSEFHQLEISQIFIKWLLYSKSDSIFNCAILVLLVCIPFLLRKFLNHKAYWILYGVMVIQGLFLWVTSPQYRFILQYVLFFTIIVISCFVRNKKTATALLYCSATLALIGFILHWKASSTDIIRYNTNSSAFENTIFPAKVSNLNATYQPMQTGNLKYNSPNNTFIWATGDGALPCLNRKQELYFQSRLGYIPQLRTHDFKDGFYPKKITNK